MASYSGDGSTKDTKYVTCTRCTFCRTYWKQTSVFKSLVTSCTFNIPNKDGATCLTCHSKNVIYLITCKKCEVQYVGLTTQKIRDRIGQHIRHIKSNDLSTFLVSHFNNIDHDLNDIKVSIIDYITHNISDSHELLELENYWIRTLNTMYPFGLNDNIKGVGNISRADISAFNADNTPYFSIPQFRKARSHGRRGKSRSRNINEVQDVLNQLLKVSDKELHLLYIALRGLSYKLLLKIREIILGKPKDYSSKFSHIILAFTSKLLKPKTSKIKDRMVFVVPYLNNIMDKLNLSGILNSKKLKCTLPSGLKFIDKPLISYKFGKTIGQSLFNYNKVLNEISVSDIEHLTCDCEKDEYLTPFVYEHHGHVHTGDLNIVKLPELRNIMKKGSRFRETPFISKHRYISEIYSHLDKFVHKWANKEGTCPSNFNKWVTLFKNIIRTKINKLEFVPIKQVLQADNVKEYISDLHRKFVICPIDKAGHNFAIVCKKFYIDVLKKELGIDKVVSGNEVYKPVSESSEEIVTKHVGILKEDFNIKLAETDRNIPLMYWISKQHKNPYKFRFIAGASHCTTKPLSVVLSLVLKLIKSHFKCYCQKIFKNSGLQKYWSIDNSLECIQKLSKVEASCIHTYDFSTLYTNLPLKDIHDKLTELVCRMYKNAYSKYIAVNSFTRKAFWTNEWKKGYSNFTLQHVLDALEFILYNTYIRFGDHIFLQTRGIPMGGNASPLIADLYLSWLEFSFLSKLDKKDTGLIYDLRHNCRYIDDIATPNLENFLSVASQIYPKEIPLEPNNGNGLHDTFLDLDINICDGDFIFKVFHKVDLFNFEVVSFPFLESNIPQRICYSTFFSQLVRFSRICSNIYGFAERVKLLWHKLLDRNYEAVVLQRYFKKFLCQYSEDILKYGCGVSDILQFCLEYDASHNLSLPTSTSPVSTDVTTQPYTSQPVQFYDGDFWASSLTRGPVPLYNLKNTCYLNCILQILFQMNSNFSFKMWINHLVQIDKTLHSESKQVLIFYKFLYLCKLHVVSHEEMCDFNQVLSEYNTFFNYTIQRDAHEALVLLLEAFNNVCHLPTADQDFSDTPDFMDYYLGGVMHKRFTCKICQDTNCLANL